MKQAIFYIRDGEVVNKYTVKKCFDLPDGGYEIKITKKNKRSLQQNRYYFGVCIKMIHDDLQNRGYDVSMEETHNWVSSKFNYTEIINEETGEVDRIPKSTTELNKEDFGIYIGKIQQYAAQTMDLVIPDAGSQMIMGL